MSVFQNVKKMVLSRVRQAVATGKTLDQGTYICANKDLDNKITGVYCCAVGAIALNGTKIKSDANKDTNWCYSVTAPLLKECGVPAEEVGFVLDAIEAGFEGEAIAGWAFKSDKSLSSYAYYDGSTHWCSDGSWWQDHPKWGKYYRLGRYIATTYLPDEQESHAW